MVGNFLVYPGSSHERRGSKMIDSWSKIRIKLKSKLGKNIFKNWIESLELVKIEKNQHFQCSQQFYSKLDR